MLCLVPGFQSVSLAPYNSDIVENARKRGCPKQISPPSETVSIVPKIPEHQGNVGVGITNPSSKITSSFVPPSYSSPKTLEKGDGREMSRPSYIVSNLATRVDAFR